MRNLKGCISDLAGLLAEDRTKKPLLCRKLCLSLRSHLAYQDVSCAHLRTDTDDSSLIQILKRVIADTRNIAGNLFRSKLGVARFCLILFYMDGCVHILLNKPLA